MRCYQPCWRRSQSSEVDVRTGRPSKFPSHCRIYAYLKDHGMAESTHIADGAHVSLDRTWAILRELRDCGLIHISGWRPVTIGGGYPAALWKFGYAEDAPRPPAEDKGVIRRRSQRKRYNELKKRYGSRITRKIVCSKSNGGADVVVVDGKIIYRRKSR